MTKRQYTLFFKYVLIIPLAVALNFSEPRSLSVEINIAKLPIFFDMAIRNAEKHKYLSRRHRKACRRLSDGAECGLLLFLPGKFGEDAVGCAVDFAEKP